MHEPLDKLVEALSRLPGIGSRSAERIALRLVSGSDKLIKDLGAALKDVHQNVRLCTNCGALTVAGEEPCRLCTDSRRDDAIMCVVEDPSDVMAIEKAGGNRGRYHVLMGRISPMRGRGPWDLTLQKLLDRIDEGQFEEVILALGTDVESDSTASFISDLLKDRSVKVSRIAFGLPAGSGITYSDPVTLERAIRGRHAI